MKETETFNMHTIQKHGSLMIESKISPKVNGTKNTNQKQKLIQAGGNIAFVNS